MTEVLLEELNSSDLQWLQMVGSQQQIEAGTILVRQNQPVNFLYIVMSGEFVATIAKDRGNLGQAFTLLEDEADLREEINRFGSGEIIGEMCFLDANLAVSTIEAAVRGVVLVVPRQELQTKLRDLPFAARFYRAIALLLLNRFNKLVKVFLRRPRGQIAPLQDVPLIFGELYDSDIDWLVEQGALDTILAGETAIEAGQQVENLYILIDGKMSVAVREVQRNSLTSVFAALESSGNNLLMESEPAARQIAQVSKGEIIGEIVSLGVKLSPSTYKAIQNCILLAIPRRQLLVKLQQDIGMGSRFYRIVVMLLAGRLDGLISRLGFGKSSYRMGDKLSIETSYEDEIDLDVIDNLSIGGARFDWMLKRLKIKGV